MSIDIDFRQSPEQRRDFAENLLEDIFVQRGLANQTELLIPLTSAKLEVMEEMGLLHEATVHMAKGHPLAALALVETVEDVSAMPLETDPQIDSFYKEWHQRIHEKMVALVAGELGEVEPGIVLENEHEVERLVQLEAAGAISAFDCADALMSPASKRVILRKLDIEQLNETLELPSPPRIAG